MKHSIKKSIHALPLASLVSTMLGISVGIMPAFTQTQPQSRTPDREISGSPSSPETADLAITSTVTARELRFNVLPDSEEIQFSGSPERQTGWVVERRNIPQHAEEGVTYRDIGVRLQITSVFSDIDAIVSDALGEAPSTNNPQALPITPKAPQPPKGTLP